jgi:hypothetical protein
MLTVATILLVIVIGTLRGGRTASNDRRPEPASRGVRQRPSTDDDPTGVAEVSRILLSDECRALAETARSKEDAWLRTASARDPLGDRTTCLDAKKAAADYFDNCFGKAKIDRRRIAEARARLVPPDWCESPTFVHDKLRERGQDQVASCSKLVAERNRLLWSWRSSRPAGETDLTGRSRDRNQCLQIKTLTEEFNDRCAAFLDPAADRPQAPTEDLCDRASMDRSVDRSAIAEIRFRISEPRKATAPAAAARSVEQTDSAGGVSEPAVEEALKRKYAASKIRVTGYRGRKWLQVEIVDAPILAALENAPTYERDKRSLEIAAAARDALEAPAGAPPSPYETYFIQLGGSRPEDHARSVGGVSFRWKDLPAAASR